jgi:two-component system phosphate regulon sensor histidine kinase PhoR
MQERHYKGILYFITAIISLTLAMQGYWMYKNYQSSKQQLVNEIQTSLDNSVERYYAKKATDRLSNFKFTFKDSTSTKQKGGRNKLDSLFHRFDQLDSISKGTDNHVKINIDFTETVDDSITYFEEKAIVPGDTIFQDFRFGRDSQNTILAYKDTDSLTNSALGELTSKLIYGLREKTIDVVAMDSLLSKEFELKKIDVAHKLHLKYRYGNGKKDTVINEKEEESLYVEATSSLLPKNAALRLKYSNITKTLLQRNLVPLLLSVLFVMAIISVLVYLLKIIKNQKQLAEVKNDLISNITHEFKTPIATIGAAMEGIKVFNTSNDTEKTLKYASISATQVEKLNGMVEKLLETATLDSERLKLNFEETDLVHFLDTIATKELFALQDKTITFKTNEPFIKYAIDRFHFENAINNIVDNALKYGGNKIELILTTHQDNLQILIKDDGNDLTQAQSKQIFNKFYRVPKGNTHDVKGFGIGLYYTKAIVEKHQGTVSVSVKPTTFKITLPL